MSEYSSVPIPCASGSDTAAGEEETGWEETGEELSAEVDSTTELFLSLTEKGL